MYPPLFDLCSADTSIQTLLSNGTVLRIYPFGEAVQKDPLPYVVWGVGDGTPENYLGQPPDVDSVTTHVDVYAATASEARSVMDALTSVLELHAHVVSWDGESRDRETRAYRVSFTVDWVLVR